MHSRIKKRFMYYSLMSGWLISLLGCQQVDNQIPVGFIVELTGIHSDLGVEARDGAQFAIETLNTQGGIQGRPLKLLVEDDQGIPAKTQQACEQLIKSKVVAIVGTMTSTTTLAALESVTLQQTLLISPAASSRLLVKKEDNLIRLMSSGLDEGIAMARYAYQKMGGRSAVGIIDVNNSIYTESVWETIQTEFKQLGGEIKQTLSFTSGKTDLVGLISNTSLNIDNNDVVFILASATDTALLLQYMHQQNIQAQFFASGWVDSHDLLRKGGRVTENLKLTLYYNPYSTAPAFTQFTHDFYTRFQKNPSFGSIYAYESILILAEGLRRTNGEMQGLKGALLQIENFPLLQDTVSINKYGDVVRNIYIATIRNGKIEILDKVITNP